MTQNKEQQQSDNPSKSSSKSWKEYFLDFFMLFLAVSLGFMADNIRENISDNAKEKEYIISMIEDAEKDKVNIKFAIASNNLQNTTSRLALEPLYSLRCQLTSRCRNVSALYLWIEAP